MKVAIVVSHPIQHFCPQYISLSKIPGFTIKVFFASMLGYKKFIDKNFGQELVWNNLRMNEFDHVFLNGDQVLQSNKELDAPGLEVALNEYKPDVLVSYGYFHKVQQRAQRWAQSNKVPIAYISDAENNQKRDFWKQLGKSIYLRWYFKKINYFFTVGNANEKYYINYGVSESRFIRMHYSIDIDVYTKTFSNKQNLRNEIRNKYNIGSEDFVLAVVGKLVEWKNQDHLIDLLYKLEEQDKKVHLLILGSGKMKEEWEIKAKNLKKNVAHFTGFVDPLNLPEYYAASDIYVHPAKVEPHSLAISEAIFMGLPVILSDRCGSYGVSDDVQEGKNGFVYPFGDIDILEKKVKTLMDNKKLCKEFSDYSHEISTNFQERSHNLFLLELKEKVERK